MSIELMFYRLSTNTEQEVKKQIINKEKGKGKIYEKME